MVKRLLIIYWVLLLCLSLFSYSLTDPNLVLSSWGPYWKFQQWMWQTFFLNNQLLAAVYLSIVASLMAVFVLLIRALQRSSLEYQRSTTQLIIIFLSIVSPLLLSYNALSHDVFNYIFNAKLLVVYNLNPHLHTALEITGDDWTRFMHNTHTAAPYGYGWTGLSIVPFWLGFNKFVTTWLAFRMWSVVSLVLLYFALQHAAQSFFARKLRSEELALFFLNPLVLLEVISSMHNDLWMVAPAVLAVSYFWRMRDGIWGKSTKPLVAGLLLMAASISIKWATIALIPLLVLILWEKLLLKWLCTFVQEKISVLLPGVKKVLTWLESWYVVAVPVAASVLLFLPLLTSRSQLFHPWYLTWSLAWIPLVRSRFWKSLLLVFSLSSMLRYIPWMLAGGFEKNTLGIQQIITWSIPAVFIIVWFAKAIPVRKNVRSFFTAILG